MVFLITLGGGYLIYKELRESTSPGTFPIEDARANIYDLSQILNHLYQSEAYARAYIQTFDKSYFDSYHASLDSVSGKLLEMRNRGGFADQGFLDNIDTISALLYQKHANMEMLFSYAAELEERSMEEISRIMVDSLQVEVPLMGPRMELEQIEDTVVEIKTIQKPKMGFFKRLSLAFKKQQTDTVYYVRQESHVLEKDHSTSRMVEDSLRNAIARTVVQYENIRRASTDKVSERTDEMLRLDAELNHRLMTIIDHWQEAEVKSSLDDIQERALDMRRFSKTLAWMGVLSFSVIVFALFFLLRETFRSQERNRALAVSESEKAVLLANREQLLLSIAHDIKSPLSTIIGSADIMERMKMPAESQKYLSYTRYASSYLKDLVTNLLEYVKWQSGELKPEPTLFRPLFLFNEIQSVYRLQAEEKGLSFRFAAQGLLLADQEDLPREWFRADALRIRQITGNLLSNAIKYTSAGFVFLHVDWTDTRLRIRVEDTGTGISEADKNRIFEDFVRVGKDEAGVEGTGLGLSITLKWVRLLGGEMGLESQLGKGSEFTVSIPMCRVDETEVEKNVQENRQKLSSEQSRGLEGCRIAVIDDDVILKRILCDYLRRLGMEARPTFNPEELLAWVSESWPQIVITDLQMPSLSGYELLEKIKSLDSDMPVILLTGKHMEDLRQEFVDSPVNFSGFLKKPVDFDELVSVLVQVRHSLSDRSDAPVPDFASDGNLSGRPSKKPSPVESGQDSLSGELSGEKEKKPDFDLTDIRRFIGNDSRQLQDFVRDFFETAYDQVEDLKIFIEESEHEKIKSLAHKMASLFGQLKMEGPYAVLRSWEAGNIPSMEEISDFEKILDRMRSDIYREAGLG